MFYFKGKLVFVKFGVINKRTTVNIVKNGKMLTIQVFYPGHLTNTAVFKTFYLDRQQLEALNMLAGKNSALAGFRLYLGRDEHGMLVGMVVGVDEKNADLVSDGIYKTGTIKSGPCPDICDKESPISGND